MPRPKKNYTGTDLMSEEVDPEVVPFVDRLTRDLRNSAKLLSQGQVRYLVDQYYQIQRHRIATKAQARAGMEGGEPNGLVAWLGRNHEELEGQIKTALLAYASSHPAGEWALSVCGIGPVIAAGLLAHIDPERVDSISSVWRYAGLDPTCIWEKGQKRPHNARLKTLCWKIGESFVKVQNNQNDYYGKVFAERKAFEVANNEAGKLADQAKAKLEKFKIGKETDAYAAYSVGKLPPAHIHARAKRYAVKLFLSHFAQVLYEVHNNKAMPTLPYVIMSQKEEHINHTHMIHPPGWQRKEAA